MTKEYLIDELLRWPPWRDRKPIPSGGGVGCPSCNGWMKRALFEGHGREGWVCEPCNQGILDCDCERCVAEEAGP